VDKKQSLDSAEADSACFLRRRSLRTLFAGRGEAEVEIDIFLIFFAKFKLIVVFKFSRKVL